MPVTESIVTGYEAAGVDGNGPYADSAKDCTVVLPASDVIDETVSLASLSKSADVATAVTGDNPGVLAWTALPSKKSKAKWTHVWVADEAYKGASEVPLTDCTSILE